MKRKFIRVVDSKTGRITRETAQEIRQSQKKTKKLIQNPRKSKLSISEIEKSIDETENEYRFRLNNPSKYDESSFRYKKITRGISLVIACEKGLFFHNKCIGSTESQSIRFSKEEFGYNISGKKKVVAWLQKHLRKFK